MKICVVQKNYIIGDITNNTSIICNAIKEAKEQGTDLVIFPELAVCGYLPDDLLDYEAFVVKCEAAIATILPFTIGLTAIVGNVCKNPNVHNGRQLQNVCHILQNGILHKTIVKTLLPTYDVFSENRYFEPANFWETFKVNNTVIGLTICEDIWDTYNDFNYAISPMAKLKTLGAELIVNCSASPFNVGKKAIRDTVLLGNTNAFSLPIIYVNQLGGHTDLLFDGNSKALQSNGKIAMELPSFKEAIEYLTFTNGNLKSNNLYTEELLSEIALLHKAIVFGIKDYFTKMGFKKAILGSSGGIDSALLQVLASQALGAQNVTAVLMPSHFSSQGSVSDATLLSQKLGNPHTTLPIAPIYNTYLQTLETEFKNTEFNVTEENLQARIRGVLLMALSNKHGHILLNTSNKSEVAVGYSTLYGDMCGSISPLGDVYKTKIYELAKFINTEEEIIPNSIIYKAPSAELRPNQKDSDSLPNYDELDLILEAYIEKKQGISQIINLGFNADTVNKIINLVTRAEFKRFQSPPIIRVTSKAFGRGRVIPLVAKYI